MARDLEALLERRLPSAIGRDDAALVEEGVAEAELAATKAAVAAVGLVATPEAPSASLRDRLLNSRRRNGKYGVFADRIARFFDLSIVDAEALLQRAEQPDAWMPFLIEGVEMMPVMAGKKYDGAIATMVRIQPGTKFPHHAHRGEETMIVLDGGFREEAGEEVWRGDEIVRTDGTDHALVGLPGTPCIAAALVIGYAEFG